MKMDNRFKPEFHAKIRARARFVAGYAARRGWPAKLDELSFEQIDEIREQDEWINPLGPDAGREKNCTPIGAN